MYCEVGGWGVNKCQTSPVGETGYVHGWEVWSIGFALMYGIGIF